MHSKCATTFWEYLANRHSQVNPPETTCAKYQDEASVGKGCLTVPMQLYARCVVRFDLQLDYFLQHVGAAHVQSEAIDIAFDDESEQPQLFVRCHADRVVDRQPLQARLRSRR